MPNSPLFAVPMLEGGSDYPTPDATADAKQINEQFKYAEQFWGVLPVTSGALPSSPKVQQLIFETDTKRLRYWNGTIWVTIEPLADKGTTAERDLRYPTPGSAAARVALANTIPKWFNTDKGYEERYYSATADASAVAWNSAATAGWYPSEPGFPYAELSGGATASFAGEPSLGQAGSPYTEVTDLWAFHDPSTNPTRITPNVSGRYRITLAQNWSNNDTGAFLCVFKNGGGSRVFGVGGGAGLGNSLNSGSFFVDFNGTSDFIHVTAFSNVGSPTLIMQLIVEYMGPIR